MKHGEKAFLWLTAFVLNLLAITSPTFWKFLFVCGWGLNLTLFTVGSAVILFWLSLFMALVELNRCLRGRSVGD